MPPRARTAPLTAETFPNLSSNLRCIMSECFLSVRAQQAGAVLRSPYEGQQGRQRFWRTFDFLKDKIADKVFFKRQFMASKLKTKTQWLRNLGKDSPNL